MMTTEGMQGTFVDIGDDGMGFLYLKNASLKGLEVQVHSKGGQNNFN
jgi:Ribonuclease G/E